MAAELYQKVDWRWYYQWKPINTDSNFKKYFDEWYFGKVANSYHNDLCSNPA